MAGTLILCATPIGNLGDVSVRLTESLSACHHIYAEDTRRTGQLLNHLGISKPMTSFFAGNQQSRIEGLTSRLAGGEVVCLVTDAGMPVVSDPGAAAVSAALEAGAGVTSVPGPSAVTMASGAVRMITSSSEISGGIIAMGAALRSASKTPERYRT